jgi:hypothetical protein
VTGDKATSKDKDKHFSRLPLALTLAPACTLTSPSRIRYKLLLASLSPANDAAGVVA